MFEGDSEWIQERIDGHLQAMELGTMDPEAALFLTTAFAGVVKDEKIEDLLKKSTRSFLLKYSRLDLIKNLGYSRYEEISLLLAEEKYSEATSNLETFQNRNYDVLLDLSACYLYNEKKDKAEIAIIELFILQSQEDDEGVLLQNMKDKSVENNTLIPVGVVLGIMIILYLAYISRKSGREEKNYLSSTKELDLNSEIAIRYFFLRRVDRKLLALKLVSNAGNHIEHKSSDIVRFLIVRTIITLWNNTFDNLDDLIKLSSSTNWFFYPDRLGIINEDITAVMFKLLLAKKQYHTAYNYFQQEEWQLKDRFKPLYYATMYFLRDEYPTEFLRMGPELKETVDDILAEVAQMAIDYA